MDFQSEVVSGFHLLKGVLAQYYYKIYFGRNILLDLCQSVVHEKNCFTLIS